jgi:hypothetical protein
MRDDIQGREAPGWLQSLIHDRYGSSPFGEPLFRLVWAPARMERSGGTFNDWRQGSTIESRRSGSAAIIRRVAEVRWVPKYPALQCWIIERWMPASAAYGTPEAWYRPITEGGTMTFTESGLIPALGAYPTEGDYEDIGAEMHWLPTERHVTKAIDALRMLRDKLPTSEAARTRRRIWTAKREQDAREAKFEAAALDLLSENDVAFGGAPMSGYGPKTRGSLVSLAERIGISSHPY